MISAFRDVQNRLTGLPEFVKRLSFVTTPNGRLASSGEPVATDPASERIATEPQDALMFASLRDEAGAWWCGERYSLLLDIDHEDVFIRKSSGGHGYHVFIRADMTKAEHDRVHQALADAGITQHGFARSGISSRFGTTLRLPWVKKGEDMTLTKIREASEAVPF